MVGKVKRLKVKSKSNKVFKKFTEMTIRGRVHENRIPEPLNARVDALPTALSGLDCLKISRYVIIRSREVAQN